MRKVCGHLFTFFLIFPLILGLSDNNLSKDNTPDTWPYVGTYVNLGNNIEGENPPILILGITAIPVQNKVYMGSGIWQSITWFPTAVVGIGVPLTKALYFDGGVDLGLGIPIPYVGVGVKLDCFLGK